MKNWKSAAVSADATLADAVKCIDVGGLQVALVIDAEDRLVGIVTDGDVRRALLRDLTMKAPVEQIMSRSPTVARAGTSREQQLAEMRRLMIRHLPLVDEQGRMVALETLDHLMEREPVRNPVLLMAGGFGTRLSPLTENCPKPMLKVGDKPILERILDNFVKAGFERFFISTHYLPEMVRDHFGDGSRWGVSIRYVHEETPLGTGGAVGLLPHEEIDLPLLMMNGDLLTTLDFRGLLDFHVENDAAATLCVREFEYQVPYGVIESEGHKVRSMVEKPMQKYFVNAGVYALSPELVRSIQPEQRVDITTILQQTMAAGQDVTVFPVHEYWLDIGRMDDFNRAQIEIGGVLR